MHTALGSPSAAWAGELTDKEIKVKYGLRLGCTIVAQTEAEKGSEYHLLSHTDRRQLSQLSPGLWCLTF